jgi:hypothetical protein
VPELLEFQPLGRGLSAKIQWQVTIRVVEGTSTVSERGITPLLQFNCGTTVTYGEDYYSSLSIKGTMEIPLTRIAQNNKTLPYTVDDVRSVLDGKIFAGIDLSRFRVTRREYNITRDKRTLEFNVVVEEKAYMDLPVGCTQARGTYTVKPVKTGFGLVRWVCTLRVTYTVRKDLSRRFAYVSFLALMALRMRQATIYGELFSPNTPAGGGGAFLQPSPVWQIPGTNIGVGPPSLYNLLNNLNDAFNPPVAGAVGNAPANQQRRALLMDFSIEEGLYSDSKTTTFSASWKMATTWQQLMLAAGVWRKLPETDMLGNNLWAISMRDVSGSVSWLTNTLDPAADVIVDFGG